MLPRSFAKLAMVYPDHFRIGRLRNIARLEELKARANELGTEQQTFAANIKAAEDILEVARKEVENVKQQRGISDELPSLQQ